MKKFMVDLIPSFIVWIFAKPYVAGNTMQKAFNKVDQLWKNHNMMSTVDLLGEDLTTKEEAQEIVEIYLQLIKGLKRKSNYVSVSLKPSALGVKFSKELCIKNLRKILTQALDSGIGVTLDMEDSNLTDVTLEMHNELKKEFSNFGTVLQTRLFRTEDDIQQLANKSHIRICIGIYNEPKDIALTNKPEMKKKLEQYTQQLLINGHFVGVATHDVQTIENVLYYLEQEGISPEEVEFQFLLGVPREKIQRKILQKGFNVRFYVPFATKKKYTTAYGRRRFLENPNILFYIFKNLLENKTTQIILLMIIPAIVLILLIGMSII